MRQKSWLLENRERQADLKEWRALWATGIELCMMKRREKSDE